MRPPTRRNRTSRNLGDQIIEDKKHLALGRQARHKNKAPASNGGRFVERSNYGVRGAYLNAAIPGAVPTTVKFPVPFGRTLSTVALPVPTGFPSLSRNSTLSV